MTSALTGAGSTRRWRRIRAAQLAAFPLCWYCGDPAEHVDHVIPRAHGGTDDPENLRSACGPCNLERGAGEDAQPSRPW